MDFPTSTSSTPLLPSSSSSSPSPSRVSSFLRSPLSVALCGLAVFLCAAIALRSGSEAPLSIPVEKVERSVLVERERVNEQTVSGCPLLAKSKHAKHSAVSGEFLSSVSSVPLIPSGGILARSLDFHAVAVDIRSVFTDSQAFWPADFNNYGPLFIRQAWHCAGSYRKFDGRGGCDGGRQRFDPERSWPDNTNLDKCKILLEPIKQKYGNALSWGDLIILAGNVAIESMGGPKLGFCGGRIDDWNGEDSLLLGATEEQKQQFPCAVDGDCKAPLGPTTLGLIYVNPEGPQGIPLPAISALQVRDVFSRMGFSDEETVALIGGGHSFGKAHGACPAGAGSSPAEDPLHPWQGKCGDGKGKNVFTSGFEGAWTLTPTQFSNDFFENLLNFQWTNGTGAGGHQQWRIVNPPDEQHAALMMLTSDVSLVRDESYKRIVQRFAQDEEYFSHVFASAWYELTTRDMGPHSRCVGDNIPPAQHFQHPLPPPPHPLADFSAVRSSIQSLISRPHSALAADDVDGQPSYGALFVQLAFHCAATFRRTDYSGGCNGARIRLSPQRDWPVNAALDGALVVLADVKEQYGATLSWADLVVLAGTVALEEAAGGKVQIAFCGGRSDALPTDEASKNLQPFDDGAFAKNRLQLKEFQSLLGLNRAELVALSGRVRSAQQMKRMGFSGTYEDAGKLSNGYYKQLLQYQWEETISHAGKKEYSTNVDGHELYMLVDDIQLRQQPEYLTFVELYAGDQQLFFEHFVAAWTKVMNADRFDGPGANLCESQ